MKTSIPRILLTICSVALCLVSLPAFGEDDAVTVLAKVHLLVGFPSAEEGEIPGTLFAPGTVLPLESGRRAPAEASGEESSDEAESFFDLAASLRRTVRLESVEARYKVVRAFPLGETVELPAPASSSSISISATLLGATDELASYRVQFFDGGEVLSSSRVAVPRGERAVIGGLDGEEAPYLFLVLEPLTPEETARVIFLGDGVTPPRAVSRSRPLYPPEAKEKKAEGVVILQAVIGIDGKVGEINVLKGLPHGLTEAAIDAVSAWIFEPALDPDGNRVAVYYNLTINFALQ